jgi:hypothetical protein
VRDFIFKWLENYPNSRFDTFKLQQHLQQKLISFSYEEFADNIDELLSENVITPVKNSKYNHRTDRPLYNKYTKVKSKAKIPKELVNRILTFYHPKMKVLSYTESADSIEKYIKHETYLMAIDAFLKSPVKDEWLSLNERSLQLFGDEKWLGDKGVAIIKKIGITLEDLHCEKIFEPFFYYKMPSWFENSNVNVLIIENKDTYGSFKSLFQQNMNTFFSITFDLLVYGEGEKIIRSIESIWEIQGAKDKEIQGYYFGDIDPKGIEMYFSLKARNEIRLKPMISFYEEILTRSKGKRYKRKKGQKFKANESNRFAEYLEPSLIDEFLSVMKEHYFPQEVLNRQILLELYRKDH